MVVLSVFLSNEAQYVVSVELRACSTYNFRAIDGTVERKKWAENAQWCKIEAWTGMRGEHRIDVSNESLNAALSWDVRCHWYY